MSDPLAAVDRLVARVREAAQGNDSSALQAAFESVLGELGVQPGDPAWTDGRDVIGTAYERLIPGRSRRALGQFFTPLWIGRVMARWLLMEPTTLVLDPACGSGSLLIATAQERSEAACTDLLGLDVDEHAIRMATANRDVRSIAALELRHGDFLRDDTADRPDAVICNPPYTRHHELSLEAKRDVHAKLTKRLGIGFSQLASLHVLFLVRALEVTADEARLAFLTPAHWLDMSYARKVKELLLRRAHVEAIISFPSDEPVFDHAVTTAAITLIRKGRDPSTPTRIVRLARGTRDEINSALHDRARDDGRRISLTSGRKWSRTQAAAADGPPLGRFANVRRGVATGCNGFFVVSEQRRRELCLRGAFLVPCAATPRLFRGDAITDDEIEALAPNQARWLLRPTRRTRRGPLAQYLDAGERDGVPDGHLVRQRIKAGRPWFQVEADFAAPILFPYFNRGGPRFLPNLAGAVPLNNWLVIQPRPGVDADALVAVLRAPSLQVRIMDNSRLYGNGLWKLEPRELADLPLPEELTSELSPPPFPPPRSGPPGRV